MDTLPEGAGALFMASSAGAVYAGSPDPPFGITSPVAANGPYGELKLAQEAAARNILSGRVPVFAGRIANLYGPRASLAKSQGLVFHLCRAAAHRQPLNLFVPMETARDYVYSDDAAEAIVDRTEAAVRQTEVGMHVDVIASGTAISVASVIATVERVTHRRVPVALGTHASAGRQVADLRMVPSLPAVGTPFPTGVRRVYDSVISRPATAQPA